MTRVDVVNLHGDEWDHDSQRPGWRWRGRSLSRTLGMERLGGTLYELEPGQRTYPYHWHHVMEELMVVVSGTPTLRTPEGEHRLEPGDAVVFRRGPTGAHVVRNDTDAPVRVLLVSSHADLEVAVYPDSGKVGVRGPAPAGGEPLRMLVPADAHVDYFDGED